MQVAFLGIVGDCCEDGGQPPFGWWVTILRKIVTVWRRWWLTIHGNPGYHPWAGKSPKYGDHPMDGGFPGVYWEHQIKCSHSAQSCATSQKLRPASRNMVRQCGSESHYHHTSFIMVKLSLSKSRLF